MVRGMDRGGDRRPATISMHIETVLETDADTYRDGCGYECRSRYGYRMI